MFLMEIKRSLVDLTCSNLSIGTHVLVLPEELCTVSVIHYAVFSVFDRFICVSYLLPL